MKHYLEQPAAVLEELGSSEQGLSTQEAVDVVEKVMAHMASESSLLLALSLFGVLDSQEKAFLEQQMRVVLLVRVWGVYEG